MLNNSVVGQKPNLTSDYPRAQSAPSALVATIPLFDGPLAPPPQALRYAPAPPGTRKNLRIPHMDALSWRALPRVVDETTRNHP